MVERRSPIPRRTGIDRRRRQRRALSLQVPRNRRRGDDRRNQVRRVIADRRDALRRRRSRRRETPSPFTVEEVDRIRRVFTEPGPPASCPACGSAFTLSRERRRGSEALRRVQCISCGKTAVVSNTRMARVMVISGKDELRDALRSILASARHEIVEAADAVVGLTAYQQNPTDVVFIDVLSAGRMEATEFIRKLRRDFPDARVVAMSSRTSFGVADPLAVAKQLGAVKTLRVPCTADEIHRAVEEARD